MDKTGITRDQLNDLIPDALAAIYVAELNAAMERFAITTEARIERFLAQLVHESNHFKAVSECLNYGAEGLMKTWPTRFPTLASTAGYAGNPIAIANRVYANRGGNGDEASGDGYRFRGAGLIQLTFRANHAKAAEYFDIPIDKIGDWLRTPLGACQSAAWFWQTQGCNELADRGDFDGISDVINLGHKTARIGDAIGYDDRLAQLRAAQAAMTPEAA